MYSEGSQQTSGGERSREGVERWERVRGKERRGEEGRERKGGGKRERTYLLSLPD